MTNSLKVCWYKLFGCRAAGSNVKVRLSDHHYPGLGQLVTYALNTTINHHTLYLIRLLLLSH